MEKSNLKRGILFALFSSFCFALMGMFVHAAGNLPVAQKAFFRNLVAAVVAFFALIKKARYNPSIYKIQPKAIKFLFLRALCGTVGIFGNFYALDRLNISDASMLNKMSPFFSILASFIFLGEKIELIPLLAVCGAFGGALLVIKPTLGFSQALPAFAGFFGGMGAGFAYAFVRKCSKYNVQGSVVVLFFSVFSCLVCLPLIALKHSAMSLYQVIMLLGAGVAASGGQFGITGAYFNAPAAKVSIYEYSMVIFSAIMGFFAFGQVPDFLSILGYAVIILIAVCLFFYNTKKSKV